MNENMEKVTKKETLETTNQVEQSNPKNKSKLRMIFVLLFITAFSLITYVVLKGSYLEYKELGEQYINVFWTNIKYKYGLMLVNFILIFMAMYFTNRGIKKGLEVFFKQEEKEMPKMPNKSISFVVAVIGSLLVASLLAPKLLLLTSNTSFGITDRIFNLDISYYMFIKPVISFVIVYFTISILFLSAYMVLYYVIVFNMYFDGIDRNTLKESNMMKKIIRNVRLRAIRVALFIILGTQNV